jgi:hypothetical protein
MAGLLLLCISELGTRPMITLQKWYVLLPLFSKHRFSLESESPHNVIGNKVSIRTFSFIIICLFGCDDCLLFTTYGKGNCCL